MGDKIYSTDDVRVIAQKIYSTFKPGDMATIFGYVMWEEKRMLIPKGDAVLEHLRYLYDQEYYGHNGRSREYKYKHNSIGGAIAHPIFTFEKKMIDQEPRVIIWRYQ